MRHFYFAGNTTFQLRLDNVFRDPTFREPTNRRTDEPTNRRTGEAAAPYRLLHQAVGVRRKTAGPASAVPAGNVSIPLGRADTKLACENCTSQVRDSDGRGAPEWMDGGSATRACLSRFGCSSRTVCGVDTVADVVG